MGPPLISGGNLGKTTACLSLKAKVAGTNPRNMMFASSTKEAAGRVVGTRLYPILASTEGVRQQLPPEARRSKLHVKLEACQIFVGWSGSETSLADVGAYFGTANEIDKWSGSASDEGDSLKLFVNRFKGFTDHKIIFESTPTIKGRSRIERLINQSNRHLRYVPCPHCGEYQVLIQGDADTKGGFRWDRDSNGNSDADIAMQTAYYECRNCEGKIENHHRVQMLRKGVWVPDGCTINIHGEIAGRATKEGSDAVGFGPLASWYSLTETWGSFARRWIQCQKRPRDMQDVVNSYKGETWEIRRSKTTPEQVAERIKTDYPRGLVPPAAKFLTCSIDRQGAHGGFVKWTILAHFDSEQAHVVDFGFSAMLGTMWEPVARRQYKRADLMADMTPVLSCSDSGFEAKDTYDFCNSRASIFPCKGSSTDMSGLPYKLAEVESGEYKGQMLFSVNTDFWESDIESRLLERLPGEHGCLTVCTEAANDSEFMEEICNSQLTDSVDKRGNAKMLWIKKDEAVNNDFRDAIRYGLALGHLIVASGGPPRSTPRAKAETHEAAFVRTPETNKSGGWIRGRKN